MTVNGTNFLYAAVHHRDRSLQRRLTCPFPEQKFSSRDPEPHRAAAEEQAELIRELLLSGKVAAGGDMESSLPEGRVK
jgi:hypothetical protein